MERYIDIAGRYWTLTLEGTMVSKRGKFWQVTDSKGSLVCVTVYKKGAEEVQRRLRWQERQMRQVRVAKRYARIYRVSEDQAILNVMDRFRDKYPHPTVA
jgi:hypothetical protein